MTDRIVRPTGHELSWLPVTILASGMELRLPVHRVTGALPGPVLGVVSGIHGDEYLPLEVVRRLVAGLDPKALRGEVLALPVANPLAFESQTRNTPIDMVNLNRIFPGDAGGWITDQMASVICEQYLPKVEYLIDLHCGGAQPTVDYAYIQNDEAMSRAFGFPVLYRPPHPYEGTLSETAATRGVKSMTVEMGGGMMADEPYIRRGLTGIHNVMKHLGMLDGAPEMSERQRVVTNMAVIRPRFGGLLYPGVKLEQMNQVVPGGTVLGTVVSPYTFDTLEVIRAPFERSLIILLRGAITKVHPGDYAYMIAEAPEG